MEVKGALKYSRRLACKLVLMWDLEYVLFLIQITLTIASDMVTLLNKTLSPQVIKKLM